MGCGLLPVTRVPLEILKKRATYMADPLNFLVEQGGIRIGDLLRAKAKEENSFFQRIITEVSN